MAITHEFHCAGLTAQNLTTTTAGSNDNAFDSVVGTGATIHLSGLRSPRIRLIKPVGVASYWEWILATARTQGAMRFYFQSPSVPPTNAFTLCRVKQSASVGGFQLNLMTTGSFRVLDASGTQVGATGTDGMLFDGTIYRVELRWTNSATTGTMTVSVFEGDSTSVRGTYSMTGLNLGPNYDRVQYGIQTTTTEVDTIYYDDIVLDNSGAALPGPHVTANQRPNANAGPDQNVVGGQTAITLDGSNSSDPDGSIASYAWARTSGPTVTLAGTGATRTFRAPYLTTAQPIVFTLTVTDDQGLTHTDDVAVNVARHDSWTMTSTGLEPLRVQATSLSPVVVTINSAAAGDGFVDVSYTVNPGSYSVTAVLVGRNGTDTSGAGPYTATRTGLTGTQRFGKLTNGTTYTFTVTPQISGTTDSTLAKTKTAVPQATSAVTRMMGMYNGGPTSDSGINTVYGAFPEISSEYAQYGTAYQGNPDAAPSFAGWSTANARARLDRGTEHVVTWVTKYTNMIGVIGQGPGAGNPSYNTKLGYLDQYLSRLNDVQSWNPGVQVWATSSHEWDGYGGPNKTGDQLYYSGDNANPVYYAKFIDTMVSRGRTQAPGVKFGVWFAGFQQARVLAALQNMEVAPDWIAFDPYVNQDAYQSCTSNFASELDKINSSTGVYNPEVTRLRQLHPDKKIDFTIGEHGISHLNHTDAEMANYVSGIREAMRDNNIRWSLYFNRDSGPQGQHKLDTYPQAKAAYTAEAASVVVG